MSTPHGLKEKQDGKVKRRKVGSKTKTGCQTCKKATALRRENDSVFNTLSTEYAKLNATN